MPYIDVNVNCEITAEKETTLKTALGEIISEIPGKSEDSLMIQFHDFCRLWHAGDNSSRIAFINVMLLGCAPKDAYKAFSDRVMELFCAQLEIDKNNIYVKFEEVPNWFWG